MNNIFFSDPERPGDVARHLGCGGCGQREYAPDIQVACQASDLQVVGAEVVAPLADAMRLVDGQEGDHPAPKRVQKTLVAEAFGGDVQQLKSAGIEIVEDSENFFALEARVQSGGGHIARHQKINLILHQRNQRRNDQGPGAVWHHPV